jgi:outer membrane protein TolC
MIMQRDFYQLQDDVVSSKARVVLDLIGLYKAVGGGWQ